MLYAVVKSPDSSVETYIKKFSEALRDFKLVGGVITKLEECRLFNQSLSVVDDKWQAYTRGFDMSPKIVNLVDGTEVDNWYTLDYLKSRLEDTDSAERAAKARITTTPTHKAFFTGEPKKNEEEKLTGKGSDPAKVWDAVTQCFNCGGLGHKLNACSSAKRPQSCWVNVATVESRKNDRNKTNIPDSKKYPGKGKKKDESHYTEEGWMIDEMNSSGKDSRVFLDSCASTSMFNDMKWFVEYTPFKNKRQAGSLKLGDDGNGDLDGVGTIEMTCQVGDKTTKIIIKHVRYYPKARSNLVSLGEIYKQGYTLYPNSNGAFVHLGSQVMAECKWSNNMYLVQDTNPIESNSYVQTKGQITDVLAHARFGHMNYQRLIKMMNSESVHGLNMKDTKHTEKCTVCLVAKSRSLPHKKFIPARKYNVCECIVGDYKGPMEESSLFDNDRGYFVCKDVATLAARIYPVRGKEEQETVFKEFKAWIENLTGKKIKSFRHDRGKAVSYTHLTLPTN